MKIFVFSISADKIQNIHHTIKPCYQISDADIRYAFLQVFNKFGKITKLDFLFHKGGPSKGKPRGYAFVEYKNEEV